MSKEYMEQLIEKEMAEYSDAAYADHASARDNLRSFAEKVLELAAKQCEARMDNMILTHQSSDFDCEAAGCAKDIRNLKFTTGIADYKV